MGENKNEGLEVLRAIRQLAKMIEDIKEEIGKLYTLITGTTIKPKEVDVLTSLPHDPMGDRIADIMEYKAKLEAYQSELCAKKAQALETMKVLEMDDQRLIMLRYFKGLTIEEIKDEMDWSYYWAWERLHRAEKDFCKKYVPLDRS